MQGTGHVPPVTGVGGTGADASQRQQRSTLMDATNAAYTFLDGKGGSRGTPSTEPRPTFTASKTADTTPLRRSGRRAAARQRVSTHSTPIRNLNATLQAVAESPTTTATPVGTPAPVNLDVQTSAQQAGGTAATRPSFNARSSTPPTVTMDWSPGPESIAAQTPPSLSAFKPSTPTTLKSLKGMDLNAPYPGTAPPAQRTAASAFFTDVKAPAAPATSIKTAAQGAHVNINSFLHPIQLENLFGGAAGSARGQQTTAGAQPSAGTTATLPFQASQSAATGGNESTAGNGDANINGPASAGRKHRTTSRSKSSTQFNDFGLSAGVRNSVELQSSLNSLGTGSLFTAGTPASGARPVFCHLPPHDSPIAEEFSKAASARLPSSDSEDEVVVTAAGPWPAAPLFPSVAPNTYPNSTMTANPGSVNHTPQPIHSFLSGGSLSARPFDATGAATGNLKTFTGPSFAAPNTSVTVEAEELPGILTPRSSKLRTASGLQSAPPTDPVTPSVPGVAGKTAASQAGMSPYAGTPAAAATFLGVSAFAGNHAAPTTPAAMSPNIRTQDAAATPSATPASKRKTQLKAVRKSQRGLPGQSSAVEEPEEVRISQSGLKLFNDSVQQDRMRGATGLRLNLVDVTESSNLSTDALGTSRTVESRPPDLNLSTDQGTAHLSAAQASDIPHWIKNATSQPQATPVSAPSQPSAFFSSAVNAHIHTVPSVSATSSISNPSTFTDPSVSATSISTARFHPAANHSTFTDPSASATSISTARFHTAANHSTFTDPSVSATSISTARFHPAANHSMSTATTSSTAVHSFGSQEPASPVPSVPSSTFRVSQSPNLPPELIAAAAVPLPGETTHPTAVNISSSSRLNPTPARAPLSTPAASSVDNSARPPDAGVQPTGMPPFTSTDASHTFTPAPTSAAQPAPAGMPAQPQSHAAAGAQHTYAGNSGNAFKAARSAAKNHMQAGLQDGPSVAPGASSRPVRTVVGWRGIGLGVEDDSVLPSGASSTRSEATSATPKKANTGRGSGHQAAAQAGENKASQWPAAAAAWHPGDISFAVGSTPQRQKPAGLETIVPTEIQHPASAQPAGLSSSSSRPNAPNQPATRFSASSPTAGTVPASGASIPPAFHVPNSGPSSGSSDTSTMFSSIPPTSVPTSAANSLPASPPQPAVHPTVYSVPEATPTTAKPTFLGNWTTPVDGTWKTNLLFGASSSDSSPASKFTSPANLAASKAYPNPFSQPTSTNQPSNPPSTSGATATPAAFGSLNMGAAAQSQQATAVPATSGADTAQIRLNPANPLPSSTASTDPSTTTTHSTGRGDSNLSNNPAEATISTAQIPPASSDPFLAGDRHKPAHRPSRSVHDVSASVDVPPLKIPNNRQSDPPSFVEHNYTTATDDRQPSRKSGGTGAADGGVAPDPVSRPTSSTTDPTVPSSASVRQQPPGSNSQQDEAKAETGSAEGRGDVAGSAFFSGSSNGRMIGKGAKAPKLPSLNLESLWAANTTEPKFTAGVQAGYTPRSSATPRSARGKDRSSRRTSSSTPAVPFNVNLHAADAPSTAPFPAQPRTQATSAGPSTASEPAVTKTAEQMEKLNIRGDASSSQFAGGQAEKSSAGDHPPGSSMKTPAPDGPVPFTPSPIPASSGQYSHFSFSTTTEKDSNYFSAPFTPFSFRLDKTFGAAGAVQPTPNDRIFTGGDNPTVVPSPVDVHMAGSTPEPAPSSNATHRTGDAGGTAGLGDVKWGSSVQFGVADAVSKPEANTREGASHSSAQTRHAIAKQNISNSAITTAGAGKPAPGFTLNMQGNGKPAGSASASPTFEFSAMPNKEEKALKQAVEKARTSSGMYKTRANYNYNHANYTEAESEYGRAIQEMEQLPAAGKDLMRSDLAVLYSNRAGARLMLGRVKEALQDSLNSTQLDPSFPRAYGRAITCHIRLGNIEEAQALVGVALKNLNTPASKDELGAKKEELRALQRVKQKLLESVTLDMTQEQVNKLVEESKLGFDKMSDCPSLHVVHASLRLRCAQYPAVLNSCKDASTVPWQCWMVVQVKYLEGDLAEAMKVAEQGAALLTSSDNNALDASQLGGLKLPSQQELTTLVAHMKELMSLKNQGNDAVRLKQWQQAVDKYTSAIALQPPLPFSAVLHCNRAWAHSNLEKHVEALADAGRAKALNPSYAKAYSRLASFLAGMKRADVAAATLESMLEHCGAGMDAKERGTVQEQLQDHRNRAKKEKTPNHYKFLDLQKTCSEDDVRRAYKKMALRFHPDKALSSCKFGLQLGDAGLRLVTGGEVEQRLHKEASMLFSYIGQAHEELSDKTKRRKVDMNLSAENDLADVFAASCNFNSHNSGYGPRAPSNYYTYNHSTTRNPYGGTSYYSTNHSSARPSYHDSAYGASYTARTAGPSRPAANTNRATSSGSRGMGARSTNGPTRFTTSTGNGSWWSSAYRDDVDEDEDDLDEDEWESDNDRYM